MKIKFIALILSCISFTLSYGQKISGWEKWEWLAGNWEGEGSGQPGSGGGTFSFTFDLDSNILIRKSHSSYPARGNSPATIHNDLMIIYPDNEGVPAKAVYFDNEAHTIYYNVAAHDSSIIFTSEKVQNLAVFRLIYTMLEKDLVNTKFEMSQDGQKFITYIEGKSKRVQK